jgi:hypothetical protein
MAISKRSALTLDTFRKEMRNNNPGPCKLVKFLIKHPEHVKGTFDALDDYSVTVAAIVRGLQKYGYTGGRNAIVINRAHGCEHCDAIRPKKGNKV